MLTSPAAPGSEGTVGPDPCIVRPDSSHLSSDRKAAPGGPRLGESTALARHQAGTEGGGLSTWLPGPECQHMLYGFFLKLFQNNFVIK